MKYDVKKIEPKWQKKWEDARIFEAKDFDKKPKFYGLVEFPYPSGAGMHVGHIKAYSSIEVVSRKRRMQGYNVLNPIGFDAFGLPTENYAIKTNTHPRVITDKNIHHFTQQLKSVGFSFDVLSNEDSQGGKCDICHNDVIQLPKKVWYLRITKYADKLLEGLKDVDYPENVKQQQVHWIGRSEGAFVNFSVKGTDDSLRVYTTRCDTLFGVTFMVVAPEHPLLDKHKNQIRNWDELENYRKECAKKTEFERTQLVKDKTGVRLDGLTAIDPVNGKEIPIFAADYVMMGYGTGAIMAVPAHDQRDWDFAHKFGCEIIPVIEGGDIEKEAYTGDGKMINSDFLNGYTNKKDSIRKMLEVLEERGIGEKGVQYKMKDWAFNRQRYWGEPIPLIHCPNCGIVPVPYDQLPLKLPKLDNFEPGQDGQSPLARVPEFVNCTCPRCGGKAQRETDTMPQWAGSSWYFLRYCDPHNEKAFADPDKLKYWMPVDWYNGGMEHVTRHMLYSRFWHRFLYDIGEVPCPEPYKKRTIQGLILGSDGDKMSKSKGNVIDPVDIVDQYGADTLRTYVLFMGDYSAAAPWNDSSVKGCRRFLDRVAGLTDLISDDRSKTDKLEAAVHRTIKKVSDDIEATKFNTAIAAMMTLINEISAVGAISKEQFETFVKLLCPFAPHLCEELWEFTGHEGFCSLAPWPVFDESKTIEDEIEVAVQENGKLRTRITIKKDATKDEAIAAAKEALAGRLTGTIRKEIYVPGRIVNFVVSR